LFLFLYFSHCSTKKKDRRFPKKGVTTWIFFSQFFHLFAFVFNRKPTCTFLKKKHGASFTLFLLFEHFEKCFFFVWTILKKKNMKMFDQFWTVGKMKTSLFLKKHVLFHRVFFSWET
jgi:hypothetical protein